MRYEIRLRIGYDYAAPVREARHVLRITPRDDRAQRIERASVEIEPRPGELAEERDFFGNSVDHLRIASPHERLAIELRARIAVEHPPFDPGRTPNLAALAEMAAASRDPSGAGPMHFLGKSRLVAPSPRIADEARRAFASPGAPAAEDILTLARLIQAEYRYEAGSTGVRTSAEEVFEARRGVCQDFAHLMIAGLRALGVPAAYVSGFIRTEPPPGQERLEGVDAMHAWVSAWLGEEIGWIGFDPTNGCLARDGHVVVAMGRDYADVAPIDGVLMVSGPQHTHHCVDVIPLAD